MLCCWDCKKTKWGMDLSEREECIKKVLSIKTVTTDPSTIQPICNIKLFARLLRSLKPLMSLFYETQLESFTFSRDDISE